MRTNIPTLAVAGVLVVAGTSVVTLATTEPAYAAATCHGKTAVVTTTQKQADAAATSGPDVVQLAARNLEFDGGPGDDTVCVKKGLHTGAENGMFIDGGPGDDWLAGGWASDDISGDGGDDIVHGYGGDDFLSGDHNSAYTRGPDGADRVYGGGGADQIDSTGGNGHGVTGADLLVGGSGNDELSYETSAVPVTFRLPRGRVVPTHGGAYDTVRGFQGYDDSHHVDVFWGTSDRDTYWSSYGKDQTHAGAGNDYIDQFTGRVFAGPGNDWVGNGNDTAHGATIDLGRGNDTAYGWNGGDPLSAGPGNDRILLGDWETGGARVRGGDGKDLMTWSGCGARVDVPHGRFRCGKEALGFASIERFTAGVCSSWYPGCAPQHYRDVLIGGPRGQTFRAGPGNDLLRGNGGPDVLVGGKGRDVAYGGTGRDRCLTVERRHSC